MKAIALLALPAALAAPAAMYEVCSIPVDIADRRRTVLVRSKARNVPA
jgi:hypothetical protein